MDDSILVSVKKMLGIEKDCFSFNDELMIYINSVFSTLYQIAVESDTYRIESSDDTWEQIFGENEKLINHIKTYTYLKVRLIFDPPTTSFVLDALNSQIKELEWRINIEAEGGFDGKDRERLSSSLRCPRNEMGSS